MHSESTVTGRIRGADFGFGKLIAVGPLTTTPGPVVSVEMARSSPENRLPCTCVYCRKPHSENQSTPESRQERDTAAGPCTPRDI